jgi:hypothetical protein
MERGAVHRLPRQHRAGDDMAGGDHELAVASGHVAFLVARHPHVRVGDIRPRVGADPVGARLIASAVPAPLPGRRGRIPGVLPSPLRLAAGRSP